MKNFLIISLLLSSISLFSQNYSVENISEELKKNAGSIIRLDETVFTVKSKSKAEKFQKYAITILHESHREKANFREVYDQFSKINSIRIYIYDKNGKKVKTVSKSDILDLSNFTKSALFANIRQKYYEPDYFEYPFTIEYSFLKTYNGLLGYPTYMGWSGYDVSIEKADFQIILPAGKELRYLMKNTNKDPIIESMNGKVHYKWSFENIKPIKDEDYEKVIDLIPILYTAPSDFEMDGYPGNSETWEDFGRWIYSLNYGRDYLPETVKAEMVNLTKNTTNKRERIKLVYEYMQSKTRYVNVIIGIGGWQPFTAAEVEKNGYGDCKALTNYTYSLLKAINIESNYALIRAGENYIKVESEFPSNQFNHAILCVPDGNDTIWLECTSQRAPFGYIGKFTEGRDALLIKQNNSQMVRTPDLSIEESSRNRKAVIEIDEQGNSKAIIKKIYQGYYYDDMRGIYYLEGKRRMDRVRNRIHIKNFMLNDEDYKLIEQRSDHPYFTENYNVAADRYVKKLGNRLLFDINFFNTEIDVPSSINKQESEIYIHRSITRIDSLEFIIPEGYFIKSFPKNDTIITNYGEFYTNFKVDGNKLCYTRKQLIRKGTFPSEEYSEFRSYLKKISMSDKQKVLVMPKE